MQGVVPYTEAELKDFSAKVQDEQSRLLEPQRHPHAWHPTAGNITS